MKKLPSDGSHTSYEVSKSLREDRLNALFRSLNQYPYKGTAERRHATKGLEIEGLADVLIYGLWAYPILFQS